jgi:hypothetical protein
MPPERLLFIVVLPAACALIGLTIAGRPWRRARPADARTGPRSWAWGGAIGFGVGFVLSTYRIVGRWPAVTSRDGWLPFGPTTGQDWIPYLAILATVLGLIDAFRRPPLWARLLIRAVVSVAAVALVLNWRIGRQWDSPQEISLWLGVLGGVLFFLWNALSRLAERSEGAPLPVALWAACAGAAGTIILAHNATFAEQLGALAACFGSAFVLSLWRSDLTLARGPIPVFAVAYGALIAAAYYNLDNLGAPAAILLAAAPLAAWITQLRPIRRKGAVARTLIALAATALPTAAAADIVYLKRPEVGPYGY